MKFITASDIVNKKMSCKVKHCRFSNHHVTFGHECGRCKNTGHGEQECRYPELKEELVEFLNERLPNGSRCEKCGSDIHKTSGHFCIECKMFECACSYDRITCPICRTDNYIGPNENIRIHGLSEKCAICMDSTIDICLPKCRHACMCTDCYDQMKSPEEEEDFITPRELERATRRLGNRNGFHVKEYAGQGCIWYIKRVNDRIKVFFMHGDSWGQYGEDTSDVPRLNVFLQGTVELQEE